MYLAAIFCGIFVFGLTSAQGRLKNKEKMFKNVNGFVYF